METSKYIIVDNNLVFREDLKSILENEFNASVIYTINNEEDLFQLTDLMVVDIIFVNLSLSRKNGFDTIKRFLWMYPYLNVVGINTFYSEQIYLLQLIEVGFKGCIDGNNIYIELNEVLSRLKNGQIFFSKNVVKTLGFNKHNSQK